jgi:branched-chain amino acid aminotransferase
MSKTDSVLEEKIKSLMDLYVYVNGSYAKGDQAKVSVWDHCLLYGDGVFEGIRLYNDKVLSLEEHLDRLYDSAKAIGLEVPATRGDLKEIVSKVFKLNKLHDAHMRVMVTRGPGLIGCDPKLCLSPSLIVMAYPFPTHPATKTETLITSSIRRRPPQVIDAKIKSCNYMDNILAKFQANQVGADDAVMLDLHGNVAEATTSNIFLVKKGQVMTPTCTAALRGITRDTLIELARKRLQLEVEERDITLQELYTADEVFVCGTGRTIVPVSKIDGRVIGYGQIGDITKRLQEEYAKFIR